MATSGVVNGNSFGGGKRYIYIQWQLASQDVGANVSYVNWQAYARFINSDAQLDNGDVKRNVGAGDQTLWSNGGRVYNYAGNISDHDVFLASGTTGIQHNSDGTKSFVLFGGIDYFGDGRSSASGTWSLPTIPREAKITNTSGNFTDDTTNPWVEFSNPAGFAVDVWFELGGLTGGTQYARRNSVGSRYTWTLSTGDKNALRSALANVSSATIKYVVKTNIAGVDYYSTQDRTLTISGGEPVFTDFDHEDANSATVAITGNDQYYIQGHSQLEVSILSADKAVAQKSATMDYYNIAVSSISQNEDYTTGNIIENLGTLGVSSNVPLVVKAVDSRNKQKSVSKTLNILPYVAPQVVATARRVNNFETSTNFHIEGIISRLTISGTDKNVVSTSTGVAYRVKKTTDVSWGSWTNKTSATSTGNISVTDFAVNLDRNFAWNVEVRIIDLLSTSVLALVVPIGTPIFRISTADNLVYNNEQPLMVSHVGQIIMSTTLTTASAVADIYGGTWVAWGSGRTPVGVDTGQTEFNTVEKTGGAKTHTLSVSEMPSHSHTQQNSDAGGSNLYGVKGNGINQVTQTGTSRGGDAPHNNLQPYITTYMWKRTV